MLVKGWGVIRSSNRRRKCFHSLAFKNRDEEKGAGREKKGK